MATKRVVLFTANDSNDYQKTVREDAQSAAAELGIRLEVLSADNRPVMQMRQLQEVLHRDLGERPDGVIVMPVRSSQASRVAAELGRAGIGIIAVNRRIEGLNELRNAYPHLPMGFISPDQREVGRIQGRQFRALLPSGGHLLYVQGDATTDSAAQRLQGMRDVIAGSGIELTTTLDGNWTESDAERVCGNFLRMVMAGTSTLDLIGCQNDAMALGAIAALKSVAEYLRRPEIARITVTGCDGVPGVGQELVKQGKLAATVILPSTGRPAIEVLAAAWQLGQRPPEEMFLTPKSLPDEKVLHPIRMS